MSKKLNNYTVMVTIKLDTDVAIKAESLEDAIVKAKSELKVTDIIEFDGGHNDSSIEVTGAYNG